MTVIIGLEHQGKVYLGGDSYCSSGITLDKCDTSKVYKVGPLGIGICGSIKAEQVLIKTIKRELKKIKKVSRDWLENKLTEIVKKEMVKEGVIPSIADELPDGNNFLIAFDGSLYIFEEDFSIWRSSAGYQAIGAGTAFAKGAMEALRYETGLSPEEKVRRCLEASDKLCALVLPPFTIIAV